MKIHLGYEIGTGTAIEIPLRHMAVTGQTQEAGKTTALEALISRSGLRALAFVTKRGEVGFGAGRRVLPYFKERADWEFVEAILEATMKQRMKFERAWIVKACRGTASLRDVRANVERLMSSSKRNMDQDLFMLLGEYLNKVVPLIESLPKARSIDLQPGLNVMDLHTYPEELQLLVISSTIRWIYEHASGVITVIPEAWKFIPQGRNTPVKVEVRKLAREGAAIKNYIWIDSQDMAGVEKEILRAAAVWLLGVQREPNEIRRALGAIPKGVNRPKEGDIPQLRLGEFFACWGTNVHRTYVQPAWMTDDVARSVASGHTTLHSATCPPPDNLPPWHEPKVEEIVCKPTEEDDMYRKLYEEARQEIKELQARIIELENKNLPAPFTPDPDRNNVAPAGYGAGADIEWLYNCVKERLVNEAPAILATVAHSKPEIEVHVERHTISMDTRNAKGRIAVLIADGAMASGKRPSEIIAAIAERGMGVTPQPRVSEALKELVELGFLLPADASGRYRAVEGVRTRIVE